MKHSTPSYQLAIGVRKMTKITIPSPELLRKLLRGNPETGEMFWRERPVEMFKTNRAANSWNTKYSGKMAFTSNSSEGYKNGRIFGVSFLAHRVIFALTKGNWPLGQIDHINGIKHDNRMKNLRSVTHAENGKNQSMSSRNKTGATGVYLRADTGKWCARIQVNGSFISLGTFVEKLDAVAARKKAEDQYGYHVNHGSVKNGGEQ